MSKIEGLCTWSQLDAFPVGKQNLAYIPTSFLKGAFLVYGAFVLLGVFFESAFSESAFFEGTFLRVTFLSTAAANFLVLRCYTKIVLQNDSACIISYVCVARAFFSVKVLIFT